MLANYRFTYLLIVATAIMLSMETVYAAFEENVGARPFGMAGVFTAVADDCNAINWNAAGLTQVKKTSIEFMFSKPFLGMDYDNIYSGSASIALPLGKIGTVGAGYQLLKSDIYSENTFLLAAGMNIVKDTLSLGVTAKLLSINYSQNDYTIIDPLFAAGYSKSGYGLDIASKLRLGQAVVVGLVAQNIISSTSLALGSLDYKLPIIYRGGVAFYLGDFVPGVELAYSSKDMGGIYVLDIAGGFEWWTADKSATLRAGISAKEVTAGLSYLFGDIGINYGFSYPLQGLSGTFGSHRVSMNVEFGRVLPVKKTDEIKQDSNKPLVSKIKIAVMDITSQNVDPSVASVITEFLRNNLFNSGKYSVLERANMDKLMKEQQFQLSGCTTTECAIELGKILNMKEMVVGSVNKLGSQYYINARMVDVESGEITITATSECSAENELAESCKEISKKLTSR